MELLAIEDFLFDFWKKKEEDWHRVSCNVFHLGKVALKDFPSPFQNIKKCCNGSVCHFRWPKTKQKMINLILTLQNDQWNDNTTTRCLIYGRRLLNWVKTDCLWQLFGDENATLRSSIFLDSKASKASKAAKWWRPAFKDPQSKQRSPKHKDLAKTKEASNADSQPPQPSNKNPQKFTTKTS